VHRQGLWEKFLSLAHIYPFRCQLCAARFLVRQPGVRYTRVAEDRRQYERIPVQFPATLIFEETTVRASVLDLSMDGCSLATSADIRGGTILQIRFDPPEEGSILVDAAVVRYIRTKGVGVQFLRFQNNERENLQAFVRKLIAKQDSSPRGMNTSLDPTNARR
jgi:hypothetical protein